ncbi:MAG: (5-formylfuran-3-yl)methyl phosphate synthase [Proteobacteria bacterium]|nr:(5-formylfuran-3-yl)methyl phosphate synthase [Pseudomonadota bacterium]
MRLLVSVRSVDEALLAARGGADFIDLKEPDRGALGGLPTETIAAIVRALRADGITLPVSATIGDYTPSRLDAILAQVRAVAACGVDYVKVGIEHDAAAPSLLDALAAWQSSSTAAAIVPVFIADRGIAAAHVARACSLGFPALMVDTADKHAGSLFDLLPMDTLRSFVARVRAAQRLAGLAGALRIGDLPRLAELAPDFAGFRSAVSSGHRGGPLDRERLRALAEALRACEVAAHQPAYGDIA